MKINNLGIFYKSRLYNPNKKNYFNSHMPKIANLNADCVMIKSTQVSMTGIKENKFIQNLTKEEKDLLSKIFKEVKFMLPIEKGKAEMSLNEYIGEYLREFKAPNKIIYHGTGYNAAKEIQKNGMEIGYRGYYTNNFAGAYFNEEMGVAEIYAIDAKMRGNTIKSPDEAPIPEIYGGIIEATLDDSCKLGQFATKDGKIIEMNIIPIICDTISDTLKKEGIETSKFVKYLQDLLIEKGYLGFVCDYGCTGKTQIIFDTSKINVENIIKI